MGRLEGAVEHADNDLPRIPITEEELRMICNGNVPVESWKRVLYFISWLSIDFPAQRHFTRDVCQLALPRRLGEPWAGTDDDPIPESVVCDIFGETGMPVVMTTQPTVLGACISAEGLPRFQELAIQMHRRGGGENDNAELLSRATGGHAIRFVVERLLRTTMADMDIGGLPLEAAHRAAARGDVDAVKALLSAGFQDERDFNGIVHDHISIMWHCVTFASDERGSAVLCCLREAWCQWFQPQFFPASNLQAMASIAAGRGVRQQMITLVKWSVGSDGDVWKCESVWDAIWAKQRDEAIEFACMLAEVIPVSRREWKRNCVKAAVRQLNPAILDCLRLELFAPQQEPRVIVDFEVFMAGLKKTRGHPEWFDRAQMLARSGHVARPDVDQLADLVEEDDVELFECAMQVIADERSFKWLLHSVVEEACHGNGVHLAKTLLRHDAVPNVAHKNMMMLAFENGCAEMMAFCEEICRFSPEEMDVIANEDTVQASGWVYACPGTALQSLRRGCTPNRECARMMCDELSIDTDMMDVLVSVGQHTCNSFVLEEMLRRRWFDAIQHKILDVVHWDGELCRIAHEYIRSRAIASGMFVEAPVGGDRPKRLRDGGAAAVKRQNQG